MPHCFLNIDLGELAGEPEELYQIADVANIACGGHAGDDESMKYALALCARYGTRPSAHPSYLDREEFGRRSREVEPERLRAVVAEQCRCLNAHAVRLRLHLGYVKPHGALYHTANLDPAIAEAVVAGAVEALGGEICLIGPAGGVMETAVRAAGLAFAREGFADRARRADGSLVPRGEPGALIIEPVQARGLALELVRTGSVDTICVHSDTPRAVLIARAARAALDESARDWAST